MKKIVILTNHSYMLFQFRRDLIKELLKTYEVVICVPFGDHIPDFVNMGCKMIDTPFDRRSMNPIKDMQLYREYVRILKEERPDKVITYAIKSNIYGGIQSIHNLFRVSGYCIQIFLQKANPFGFCTYCFHIVADEPSSR